MKEVCLRSGTVCIQPRPSWPSRSAEDNLQHKSGSVAAERQGRYSITGGPPHSMILSRGRQLVLLSLHRSGSRALGLKLEFENLGGTRNDCCHLFFEPGSSAYRVIVASHCLSVIHILAAALNNDFTEPYVGRSTRGGTLIP